MKRGTKAIIILYFRDALPANVVITRNLTDDTKMAKTEMAGGYYHIAFNPRFNQSSKTERLNLLHEMCHVYVEVGGYHEFDDHGPIWESCMHVQLADRGAFDDLW